MEGFQSLVSYEEYLALTRAEDEMKRKRFTGTMEDEYAPREKWEHTSDGGWRLVSAVEEEYEQVLRMAYLW